MKPVFPERTIIIGDVHGCLMELEALLAKLNYQPQKDSLYFLGDIINRGPHSKACYDKVKSLNAVSLMGNHEWHLLDRYENKCMSPRLKRLQQEFGTEFNSFIRDVAAWPAFVETDDFILVHGGVVPGRRIEETNPYLLASIRTWDEEQKKIGGANDKPWFDYYQDSKLVVFGHWAALEGVVRDNVIGLDTGCVYGKKMTALVLPERRLVSVDAQRVYHPVKE